MIIKVAALSKEEEDWVRKSRIKPEQVKGNSALINFAHPAVLVGGILGNTAAGVASDRLFNNDAIFAGKKVSDTLGKRIKNVFVKEKITHHISPSSFMTKLKPNALRAVGGAVGGGLGALAVKGFRSINNRRDEK